MLPLASPPVLPLVFPPVLPLASPSVLPLVTLSCVWGGCVTSSEGWTSSFWPLLTTTFTIPHSWLFLLPDLGSWDIINPLLYISLYSYFILLPKDNLFSFRIFPASPKVSPTTLGIFPFIGPLLNTKVTTSPSWRIEPDIGCWDIILPFSTSLLYSSSILTLIFRFNLSRLFCASSNVKLYKFGVVIWPSLLPNPLKKNLATINTWVTKIKINPAKAIFNLFLLLLGDFLFFCFFLYLGFSSS